MPAPKPISKDMCLAAMDKTKSIMAAARYLNCSYHHLKKYMKLYKDEESGKTLFQVHKNQQGKGIPKFLKASGKEPALMDIIEGKINAASFSPDKLKYRLTTEGYLELLCVLETHNYHNIPLSNPQL